MKPKILMIVNEFPPVGESGVQRPLKFLKYLDKAGWDTYVITPRRLPKSVLDESLCSEIPERTKVYKTASWGISGLSGERFSALKSSTRTTRSKPIALYSGMLRWLNHFLFPLDKQIGWVPFALVQAIKLIRKEGIRNIYITAFPYSAFLIGIYLKKIFGSKIRWIADYRDTWQFELLLTSDVPAWRQRTIRAWDKKALKSCDRAVFVTPYIRELYIKTYPWLKNKSSTITNGYDEDDFTGLTANKWDKLSLLFMGKMKYLATFDPRPLLQALTHWQEDEFQLLHIGSLSEEVREVSAEYKFFHYHGYKSHREALEWALGADINLIMINDPVIIPGKMFELLRVGKPILVLGPDQGNAKELITTSHAGVYAGLNDEAEIVSALEKIKNNPDSYKADSSIIAGFSREKLCGDLIKLYE